MSFIVLREGMEGMRDEEEEEPNNKERMLESGVI